MRKKSKRLAALLLSFLMVISMIPVNGLTVEAAAKPKLAKKSVSIVIGGTSKIKVKNAPKGAKITYKSAKKSIATVSKQGKVKGIKSGTTKITVSVKKNSKTTKLTYKVTVKKPKLSKSKLSLVSGKAAKLSVKNKPKKAKYTWQSSNTKIATVNKNGKVVAKAKGIANIKVKVKTAKKTYSLSCKVTVKAKTNNPEEQTYTVTFNSNGGSAVASQTVKKNDFAKQPANPTRDGYTFDGWYTEVTGGQKFNFNTAIIKNIILYAHWTEISSGEPTTYTRGEWIDALANMVNMNLDVADVDSINYSYADLESNEHRIAIETAERYGILPKAVLDDESQDVPSFYPDEIATREFAAITTVRAMGFTEKITEESDFYGDILTWADYNDIDSNYVDEIAIAVGFGFLTLNNGNRFEPTSAMTTVDATSIRTAIDALNASTSVAPEDEYDHTTYADGVIKDELSASIYTVNELNDQYIVTVSKTGINAISMGADDIIVLPANNDYPAGIAFKVLNIVENADSWELSCVAPELWEVYDEIDFSGHGSIATSSIETPEGIDVEYDPNGTIEDEENPRSRANINLGGSTSIPGTLKFTVASKTIGNLKLKGSVEVEIPEVTGIVKGKFGLLETKLDEFTLSIKEKIKLKGDLTYTLAESGYELTSDSLTGTVGRPGNVSNNTRWENGSVEIGRVPIPIVAGLSFDIVFFYNVSIKGTTSITYTIESKQGFQYKNGTPRWIFEYNDSLDFLEIKGSAKAGLGIRGVLCALNLMDLIGLETEGGVGFNASFTPHILATDTLFCSDVTLYPYWETSLSTDTVVGKFLETVCHYTLTVEHLKNDSHNSFKLGIHVENCKIVPECTFGRGCITGHVAQADDTTIPIGNARINIYNVVDDPDYPGDPDHATSTLTRTRYTDSQGNFKADNLTPGTYKVVVSATGYTSYTATVTVESTGETVVESFLMVNRQDIASQTIMGDIMDAVTGNGVTETSYTLRNGRNIQTGAEIEKGIFEDSIFTLTLNPGTYTLEVKKDDYITAFSTITVTESGATGTHIALSPVGGGEIGNGIIRVILTWGEEPSDLDSHLFGPTSNDTLEFFHTYYGDEEYYDGSTTIADLDRDDTDSYGPETTTIHEIRTGSAYSFYVHDYTNRHSSDSTAMSMSNAVVRVYNGNTLVRTFAIPVGKEGTVWHVFDYNPLTDTIIPVNTFSYSEDPETLGISSYSEDYILNENIAIQMIAAGTDDKGADTLNTADNIGDEVNSSDDLNSTGENDVPIIEDSNGINQSLPIEEKVN